jgi:hypothetical protein
LPISFACPTGISYAAGGGPTIGLIGGYIQHTHSLLVVNPPAGGTKGPFTITSGPYVAPNGFALSALLDGFASFQGDAGSSVPFAWSATLTGTFGGQSVSVTDSGSILKGQQKIRKFDLDSFPGRGEGDFVSTLTVFTSGPGELHLERTGIATLAVPEPQSWALMILGFGTVGASLRLQRRRRIATA